MLVGTGRQPGARHGGRDDRMARAHGAWSSQAMSAAVGAGGHLCWTPEPLIAVAGCRHRSSTFVELAVRRHGVDRRGGVARSFAARSLDASTSHGGSSRGGRASSTTSSGWVRASQGGGAGHRRRPSATSSRRSSSAGRCRRTARPRSSAPTLPRRRLQIADDTWVVLAVGTDRPAARGDALGSHHGERDRSGTTTRPGRDRHTAVSSQVSTSSGRRSP